jgi:hypothetical protein
MVPFAVVSSIAALALAACPQPLATDDDPDSDPIYYEIPPGTVDGSVFDVAVAGHTLYLAGNFGMIGEETGSGLPILASTGAKPENYPNLGINGAVYAAAPDGTGGWYVGGTFTKVGSATRNGIARINADGSLHAWNPNALDSGDYPASVRAIFVHGSLVYVGGTFWKIGGQSRRQLAAIDADGLATDWNPNPNYTTVDGLRAVGNKLYVLGDFTNIAGTSRPYMAAFSLTDGSFLASGAPAVGGRVHDLAFDATYAYAVGDFNEIGGVTRTRIARFSISSNTVDSGWYPAGGADGSCSAVAVDGMSGRVLVGGVFSTIGGQSIPRFAALSGTDGSPIADAVPETEGGGVHSLEIANGLVYAGGSFVEMDGEFRPCVAAFDPADGALSTWNPGASRGENSVVYALSAAGDRLFVGGDVQIIGGFKRRNLAAIDLRTGEPTSWNPGADAPVNSIALGDGVLYALGGFGTLGGASRRYLGAVSLTTGLATAFAPEPDLRVNAIALAPDRLYAGGDFTQIGGAPRSRLAALSLANGSALAWDPDVGDYAPDDTGSVEGIAVSGSTVYVVGWFPSIGGAPRSCLAALDSSTGAALAWNPFAEIGSEPDNGIRHVFAASGAVFVFGYFQNAGATVRNSAAAFDATSGALLPWDPDFGIGGNCPHKVVMRGGMFYLAGGFASVGGAARASSLAAISTAGALSDWDPSMPGGLARCIAVSDTMIFAGGDFTEVDGLARRNVVSFSRETGVPY